MPALPSSIIEPVWDQCAALLPAHWSHPLGWHRPRIRDRVVFDKLVQVLVFGCAYHRIADDTVSATTLRRRREAVVAFWIAFSAAIIVVGRLVREGWLGYRWDSRADRRP